MAGMATSQGGKGQEGGSAGVFGGGGGGGRGGESGLGAGAGGDAMSGGAGIAGAPSATRRPLRPSFLFILADDQRNDFLGVAGHPVLKTPNIDKLAGQGVRFTNAFVTTSICAASRASIFTGLLERTHGYTFGTPPISMVHGRQGYAAKLSAAGYRTGHIGKFGVQSALPGAEMFDVFHDFDRPYFRDGKHLTNLARDLALEFLDTQPADQPFALQVSFSAGHAEDDNVETADAHYPYAPEEKGLYEGIPIPRDPLDIPAIFDKEPSFLKSSLSSTRYAWGWAGKKYEPYMRNYLRLLSGIDRVLGDLRAKLEARGLADNTIIIYLGDNGYFTGGRMFQGKWNHYEQSLRVPLILYDPLSPTHYVGSMPGAMALNIDVPATLLALADVEVPASYQGQTLGAFLGWLGNRELREDFMCEHHADSFPRWEGVRSKALKYAKYYEQVPPYEALFDLKADPDELNNLAGSAEHADELAKMRARLMSYKQQYPAAPSLQ